MYLISSAGRTGGRAECSTADLVSVPYFHHGLLGGLILLSCDFLWVHVR